MKREPSSAIRDADRRAGESHPLGSPEAIRLGKARRLVDSMLYGAVQEQHLEQDTYADGSVQLTLF